MPTIEQCIRACAKVWGVHPELVRGFNRDPEYSHPRFAAALLARGLGERPSLAKIAAAMGRSPSGGAMTCYQIKKAKALMEADAVFRGKLRKAARLANGNMDIIRIRRERSIGSSLENTLECYRDAAELAGV